MIERMQAAADSPYAAATDLAEWLVEQGTPFRDAHAVVGRVVRDSLERHVRWPSSSPPTPQLGRRGRRPARAGRRRDPPHHPRWRRPRCRSPPSSSASGPASTPTSPPRRLTHRSGGDCRLAGDRRQNARCERLDRAERRVLDQPGADALRRQRSAELGDRPVHVGRVRGPRGRGRRAARRHRRPDVVEIGCGTAYISAWLARRGAPAVVGHRPDPWLSSPPPQALGAEIGPAIPLVRAAGEAVPAPQRLASTSPSPSTAPPSGPTRSSGSPRPTACCARAASWCSWATRCSSSSARPTRRRRRAARSSATSAACTGSSTPTTPAWSSTSPTAR